MPDDDYTPEPPPTNSTAADGGYSLTERIFGALSNKRRRYILYFLQDNNYTTVESLATQIATWEQSSPSNAVPKATLENIHTQLVHSDLPKLADYGIVEYDDRSGAIRYSDPPALLEEALTIAALVEKPE